MGVLEGVKVLDCSQYGTGPYATLLLSFLGAEVTKLEIPSGDPMRAMSTRHKGISYPYALVNLNKKCITLNLKKEKGREIFKKLIKQTDILVENFLPGIMEEWGLSYEVLSTINPRIIYASISGFGRGSKYEKIPAYDPIIQAMGGAMGSTGFPGSPPTKAAAAYADFGSSAHLLAPILGALYHREKSGLGQRIDLAMRDTILHFPLGVHNVYYESKKVEKEIGNRGVGISPYNTYQTKDGYIYIVGITDNQANSIMKAIGREDYISSGKYKTAYERWRNREEIDQMIEDWTKERTKQEIFKIMSERNIPCSPVLTIEEVWNDEDLTQREIVVEIEQPGMGKIKVLNLTLGISPPEKTVSPAPLIGQHNREVYTELLGMAEDEIKRLQDEDTI